MLSPRDSRFSELTTYELGITFGTLAIIALCSPQSPPTEEPITSHTNKGTLSPFNPRSNNNFSYFFYII